MGRGMKGRGDAGTRRRGVGKDAGTRSREGRGDAGTRGWAERLWATACRQCCDGRWGSLHRRYGHYLEAGSNPCVGRGLWCSRLGCSFVVRLSRAAPGRRSACVTTVQTMVKERHGLPVGRATGNYRRQS